MEEERRRRLSLVKDEEAKEAHEKETRRQHRLIAVLEEEEARARAFYEYEFQNNLRERRDMKEAEQATRLFMLESKSSGGSKYDVGGATTKKSSKQERRDELKKAQAQKLIRERECKEMSAEDDLAMAIRTEEKKAEQLARSRSPVVWRCLHFLNTTRVHLTRSGLVSFLSLRPLGPRSTGDAPRRLL